MRLRWVNESGAILRAGIGSDDGNNLIKDRGEVPAVGRNGCRGKRTSALSRDQRPDRLSGRRVPRLVALGADRDEGSPFMVTGFRFVMPLSAVTTVLPSADIQT